MKYPIYEPENNPYMFIVADITHRCNMTCKNCYVPNREIPDMSLEKFRNLLSRLPKRTMIRLIGAEPTMNRQLPEFISSIKEFNHRHGLLTNGLRMSHQRYLDFLIAAGLDTVYISLNGVDNDDWYEAIDEMRCAKKKLKAVENIVNSGLNLETGTILVKGVNEEAPHRLHHLFEKHNVKNTLIRIKNVGQMGRYMDEAVNTLTKDDLISLCADGFGISKDFIYEYKESGKNPLNHEENSIVFPLDYNAKTMLRGRWVKITNWCVDNDQGYPDPGSERRGRITEDFKIAPFFEHAKDNEFGY